MTVPMASGSPSWRQHVHRLLVGRLHVIVGLQRMIRIPLIWERDMYRQPLPVLYGLMQISGALADGMTGMDKGMVCS